MSWTTATVLLVACASLGVLVGLAPTRVRTGRLAFAAAPAAVLVFLPGTCVTAIASTPFGGPEQLDGRTSCDTLYGAALPELGTLGADRTGSLLALTAAVVAVSALAVVRRHRAPASARTTADGVHRDDGRRPG